MAVVNIINKSTIEYNPACNLVWGKELCLLTWLKAVSMAFVAMSGKCSKPKGQSSYLICFEGEIWLLPWFLFEDSCWPLQRVKDLTHGSMWITVTSQSRCKQGRILVCFYAIRLLSACF